MREKNKKIKVILLIISLIGIMGIMGLFAYFTDYVIVKNKVKMGIVDIILSQYTIDLNGNKTKFTGSKDIVPGEVVSNITEISCVKGSESCYVRARADLKNKNNELISQDIMSLNILNIDKSKWYYCKEDGYYYYKIELTDENPAIFFTEIRFPSNLDNTWALENIKLDIVAEAVQARNFTPNFSKDSKNPWPGILPDDIEKTKK